MDVSWRVFWTTLGVLALLAQPGVFLNDEIGQVAALTSLTDGDLLIDSDLPSGYDPYLRGIWVQRGLVPDEGQEPRANAGSWMTNILALPILTLFQTAALAIGPMGATGLATGAAAAAGAYAWRRDRLVAGAVGSGLFLGAVAMQAWFRPPTSPYLEMAALQWLGILMHAFAATLLYDLLRTRVARPGLATAVYAFATPALFWTLNLKYHGMGIALVAIAVWLYQEGHRTGPLRTGLAFAVAGLSIWNHLPTGLLLTASMGIMAMPAVTLGLRRLAVRVAAGAAGLATGLLPEVLERWAHARIEVRDRFIQVGTAGGEDLPAVAQQVVTQNERGRLARAVWNDPGGTWDAVIQVLFWPDRWTPHVGAALPLLVLCPLVVLFWWAWRRPWPSRVLLAWPLVHVALLVAVFGGGMLLNGSAFDFRHTATIWPLLALPIGLVMDRLEVAPRRVLAAAGAMTVTLATLMWTPLLLYRALAGRSVFMAGTSFEYVDPLRYLGLAAVPVLLFAVCWHRWRAWRSWPVAIAVAWMFILQAVIQLGPARGGPREASWPFTAWPVALLERAVEWFLVGP